MEICCKNSQQPEADVLTMLKKTYKKYCEWVYISENRYIYTYIFEEYPALLFFKTSLNGSS